MKNRTKHTPGPWKLETHKDKLEVWSNNHYVAGLSHDLFYSAEKHGFQEGNATLIASAPDLLEALEALFDPEIYKDSSKQRKNELAQRFVAAGKAIAKAKGETK
jgi:hypothetical protein